MNDQIIRITRALNHPIRIQILYYLNDNKQSSVNNLVKQFDVSQPAISRHLRILEEARLVKSERVKQEKYYYLFSAQLKSHLPQTLRKNFRKQFPSGSSSRQTTQKLRKLLSRAALFPTNWIRSPVRQRVFWLSPKTKALKLLNSRPS